MNASHMMEFGDWLKHRSINDSWITVAQHNVTEYDGWKKDLFMTSILAEISSHKDLLTDNEWLADNDFGKEVEIDVGQVKGHIGKNTVRIEPFTFLRHWNDTWPDSFELVQSFILFYNLHFDVSGNKYVAVDGAGETTDVVRIKDEEQHEKIEIRDMFLRNYLACKDLVLVRQHDNRIHIDRTLAELGIEHVRGRRLDGSDYVFELILVDGGLAGKGPAIGLLNGKDLVWPHDKYKDLLGFPKGDCEFIVGVDAHGENIMEPCAECGSEMYLTPVYFERDVLKRYRDSTKYKVSQGMVSCGAHWNVRIQQNSDQVMVFLGDLASLPANEQPHWRRYNMRSEIGTVEIQR